MNICPELTGGRQRATHTRSETSVSTQLPPGNTIHVLHDFPVLFCDFSFWLKQRSFREPDP